MIQIENLTVSFKSRLNKKKVLDNIHLNIYENEIVGLMGQSGCGKTTVAKSILGLVRAECGNIWYKDIDLLKLKKNEFKRYRKDLQLISQNPSSFFDPSIKLKKSVLEPLKNFNIDQKDKEQEINSLLDELKLDKTTLSRYPHQVSGGEIQRISILRALLLEPKLLILDEATSMLDISVQAQILSLLKEIKKKRKISFLFISHDEKVAKLFSDRILRMEDGKIVNEYKKLIQTNNIKIKASL